MRKAEERHMWRNIREAYIQQRTWADNDDKEKVRSANRKPSGSENHLFICKFQNEDELDVKATYLTLIPGFEGHHQVFSTICERLKLQAMACQLEPDVKKASIKDMAAGIMEVRTAFFTQYYYYTAYFVASIVVKAFDNK